MDDIFEDDFMDDGLDPDEINNSQDEYEEDFVTEEPEDSEVESDFDNAESREELFGFDPFWLGAGFGYEMGRDGRSRKPRKKK